MIGPAGVNRTRWTVVHAAAVTCLAALVAALVAVGVAGLVTTWSGWGQVLSSFAIAELAIGLSWSVVGLFLAARRPRNPLSWILLVVGLAALADRGAAALDEVGGGADLAAAVVAVGRLVPMPPFPLLPALALVLFPDGRPPGRRWWWLLTPVLILASVVTLGARFAPDPDVFLGPLWDVVSATGGWLLVAGVVALVLRHRRADAVVRLQVRGVLYAMGVAVLVVLVFVVLHRPWIGNIALSLVPLSIGAAIMRYRLFDIDRIISRTVAYSLLVALLAAVYLGMVVGLGAVARAVTGESGDLVVALSTLAVAALFRPVRQRTQALVDRRFNRARYDAARTVDAFGRELRDQVSLDSIVGALRSTTGTTVRPASVGVVLTDRAAGDP